MERTEFIATHQRLVSAIDQVFHDHLPGCKVDWLDSSRVRIIGIPDDFDDEPFAQDLIDKGHPTSWVEFILDGTSLQIDFVNHYFGCYKELPTFTDDEFDRFMNE